MKTILSPYGLALSLGLNETIELAKEFGYSSIMYASEKATSMGIDLALESAQRQGVPLSIYYHLFDLSSDNDTFLLQMKKMKRNAEIAQVLFSTLFILSISPGSNHVPYEQNIDRHCTRIRMVADLLNEYNICLALEFISIPGNISTIRYPFVHKLSQLLELIHMVDRENVKVVLDTYHLFWSKEIENVHNMINTSQVAVLQVNDLPNNYAFNTPRIWPMDTGIVRSDIFVKNMRQQKYQGFIMVETCNKALGSNSFYMAEHAMQKLNNLLG